jgi:hypothetical protein
MVVMERAPELNVRSASEAELRVERTEISFHDLGEDRVRIKVTVHNDGPDRSRPTLMRLESAPFGAFVPWRPLTQMMVPSLEPGESRELVTEVVRPRPLPLGDFNRVPPKRLLTALSTPDQPSPPNTGVMALLDLMRRGQTGRSSDGVVSGQASLAPDLWDLLNRGQPHWAGNINVFVGRQAVERHMAKALRVYAGRTNLAMFIVGSPGRRDAFTFELVGLSSDWHAALYDMTNHKNLLSYTSNERIHETQWVETSGGLMVMVAIQPPADCPAGNLEVHVTRRGCDKSAIVEFDLDPKAQGAGCYFI